MKRAHGHLSIGPCRFPVTENTLGLYIGMTGCECCPTMLTQRSRYAMRAMLYLATMPADSPPVPMNRIATHANVPRKFLELILADLRDAGFLYSHRGKAGGYVLSRAAHLISLGEVIRVIEGPLALVPCVSRTAYRPCNDCKDEATCAIRIAMSRVRDETARILDGTSLADAVAKEMAAA